MAENWYYISGPPMEGPPDERQLFQLQATGQPLDFEQLKRLACYGELRQTDALWNNTMPSWVLASTIPELFFEADGRVREVMQKPRGAADGPRPNGGLGWESPPAAIGTAAVYAGFGLRAVAMMIDAFIVFFILLPFVVALIYFGNVQSDDEPMGHFVSLFIVGGVWLYFAFQESGQRQATFGKRAMGLRVTDMEGKRISFWRATGRHFGKFLSELLLCIGYVMAGFTEKKQALHDIMADCLVLKIPRTSRHRSLDPRL
jgi:uncharacterized RDD family membrane protein YckC